MDSIDPGFIEIEVWKVDKSCFRDEKFPIDIFSKTLIGKLDKSFLRCVTRKISILIFEADNHIEQMRDGIEATRRKHDGRERSTKK